MQTAVPLPQRVEAEVTYSICEYMRGLDYSTHQTVIAYCKIDLLGQCTGIYISVADIFDHVAYRLPANGEELNLTLPSVFPLALKHVLDFTDRASKMT